SGTGSNDWLELRHVSDTADIRVDDIVVSSGLGQRFPAGYPVGRVTHVNRDAAQPFAEVRVEPTAQLNRSRYLLLVFSPESAYGDVFQSLNLDGEEAAAEAEPAADTILTETPPAPPEEHSDAQ